MSQPSFWLTLNTPSYGAKNGDGLDESDGSKMSMAILIGYVYVAPVIMIIGLVGSLASLATLTHRRFSSRFFSYLKALAVADLCFLSFAMASIVHTVGDQTKPGYTQMIYEAHFEEGLTNGFLAASVFVIVCMTLDRYYAICRPTFYLQHRTSDPNFSNQPLLEIFLAFSCGIIFNIPRFLNRQVQVAFCKIDGEVVSGENVTLICHCGSSGDPDVIEDPTCFYDDSENERMTNSDIWKTYVVLSELGIRIFPSFLLVLLNITMIRDFNVSVRRRQKLRASVFTISKSSLYSRTVDMNPKDVTQRSGHPEDVLKRRVRKRRRVVSMPDLSILKRQESLDDFEEVQLMRARFTQGHDGYEETIGNLGITSEPVPDVVPPSHILKRHGVSVFGSDHTKVVDKLYRNREARKKSLTMSGREKSVIVTLSFISLLFVFCNIPQAVMRLMLYFGSDSLTSSSGFEIFRVVANVLEVINCSSNFFLYCLCNKDVRARVRKLLHIFKYQVTTMPKFARRYEAETTATEGSQFLREIFPEIFRTKSPKPKTEEDSSKEEYSK